jgi:hypothetical protein
VLSSINRGASRLAPVSRFSTAAPGGCHHAADVAFHREAEALVTIAHRLYLGFPFGIPATNTLDHYKNQNNIYKVLWVLNILIIIRPPLFHRPAAEAALDYKLFWLSTRTKRNHLLLLK